MKTDSCWVSYMGLDGDIGFTIRLSKTLFGRDEPITLNMILQNKEAIERYINSRFLITYDVKVQVLRGGEVLPFLPDVLETPVFRNRFIALAPGQCIYAGFDLRSGFTMDRVGSYEVSATYSNSSFPRGSAATSIFIGESTAAPVSFRVG